MPQVNDKVLRFKILGNSANIVYAVPLDDLVSDVLTADNLLEHLQADEPITLTKSASGTYLTIGFNDEALKGLSADIAAAKTEVTAGDNIKVTESKAEDGHTIYEISGLVLVTGTDGSIKVDTTTLPNGVQYDLSVNTDIIATKESVDGVKTDLVSINNTIDTLSNTINDVGKWEDIVSEFNPTSVITHINRFDIKINTDIGLIYFNIDCNGNFYRDSSTIRQILFTKSSAISDLTFKPTYGIYNVISNNEYKMPYQIACRDDGINGWLPSQGMNSNYILVSGIVPIGL